MKIREGLAVKLQRIPGITPKRLLEEPYFFQCPPLEDFTVEYAFSHTDYETVREGQFSRKGGRQLRVANFSTLVVDWGRYTLLRPADDIAIEDHTALLIELVESGDPFLMTAAHDFPRGGYGSGDLPLNPAPTGDATRRETPGTENWSLTLAGPEIQMPATLRSLRVTEKAGEGDARYLECSFVEYRDPVVSELRKGKRGKKRPAPIEFPLSGRLTTEGRFRWRMPSGVERVTNEKNVSMADLAKIFYGLPEAARSIATENMIFDWGFNEPLIKHRRFWHEKKDKRGGGLTIPAPFDAAIQGQDTDAFIRLRGTRVRGSRGGGTGGTAAP